jgi:hypothetical protein
MGITSNQLDPKGNFNASCYWSAATFGPDTEAYITITTKPADGNCAHLTVRESGSGGSISGYFGEFCSVVGADTWDIYRFDNGVGYIYISTHGTQELSNGDSMGLEAIGSSIKLYYKPAGGSWTVESSATDSTYSGAGRIAVGNEDPTYRADDFGGGTVPGSSGQTIMASSTPAIATGRVKYRLSASPSQTAGVYSTVITYTILGTF